MIIAYEPVWAVGAPAAAATQHIREICAGTLGRRPEGLDSIIYGGVQDLDFPQNSNGRCMDYFLADAPTRRRPGSGARGIDEAPAIDAGLAELPSHD